MSQENEYRPIIIPTEVQPPLKRWQECGQLIANHLRRGDSLILDMDGVVVKSDSLDRPELTTPKIIPSIKTLENLGFRAGVATARGGQIVEFLRSEYDLQMKGPLILEDGHVLVRNEKAEYIANPNHPKFISSLRQQLMLHPSFQSSWNLARLQSESFGKFAFCHGGFQWQGENRASLWFSANGDNDYAPKVLPTIFEPTLRRLARESDLDYEKDVDVSVSKMAVGNLSIVSIKGKVNGNPISKGSAAERLEDPWVLAADGFGDIELGIRTKELKGAVIGIGGNLDFSSDPGKFLRGSDLVLRDPEEFTQALSYAAICLENSR